MQTFREYARSYIARKSYDYAASTVCTYSTYVDKISAALSEVPLMEIKPRHNDQIVSTLRAAELSDHRINLIMIFYFQVMTDAHENGDALQPKKYKRAKQEATKEIKEFLNQETIDLVIASIEKEYQPIFKFIAATGCRPCEAMGLKWNDILDDAIVISRGLVRGIEGKTKTKRSRALHLTPQLRRLLANQPRNCDYVFSKNGKPITRNLDRVWNRAAHPLGITQVFYNLRHSFASNLLAQGATLPAVSRIIGHSNVRTTARYYCGTIAGDETNQLLDQLQA